MNNKHIGLQNNHWFIIFSALLLISIHPIANADPELFTKDASGDITLMTSLPPDSPRLSLLPILFVHGHLRNYEATWLDSANGLTSFGAALTANNHLRIEPYFINFQNKDRSIVEDAVEIGQAVDIILDRHNANYDPANPNSITQQLVIIAYSKGTISTRLYLKGLYRGSSTLPDVLTAPGITLPEHGANFRPVSEFIAIAPPNHGIKPLILIGTLSTNSLSLPVKQLRDGYGSLCHTLNDNAATDFIGELNGHPMQDTHASAVPIAQVYPSEAPGSRSINQSSNEGVLYVTIYSDQNRDLVGGDDPPGVNGNGIPDCLVIKRGRKLAKNLAPNAQNVPIISTSIPGTNEIEVHRNTIHACEVIYRALYTAVHHQPPASIHNDVCLSEASVPEIPHPYVVWYRWFIAWWHDHFLRTFLFWQ